MPGTLKFTESLSLTFLDQNWSKVKDDYEGAFKPETPGQTHPTGMGTVYQPGQQTQEQTQQGLLVQIAATHAGIITRNNGFYLPDRMRTGAPTFTKDYPKPVLLHHEDHKDPIGRVIEALYTDTSGLIQDKYCGLEVKNKAGEIVGTITDKLLKDFNSGAMPFGQSVDVVRTLLRDTVLEDQGYRGLGYIRILASITDPAAVPKLIDGRYITGSVGATTNKAVCSICRTDWTNDGGACEHKPGGVYDGAKCFIIAGDLTYDEYSFVNVPADRHSRVLQLDYNGQSTEIELVNDFKSRICEVQLSFPQYDSADEENKGMPTEDTKKTESTESAEGSTNIKDAVTDPALDAETQKTEGVEKVADSTSDDTEDTKEKVSDEIKVEKSAEDNVTTKDEEPIEDFVTRVLDSDEKLFLSDEEVERLYEYMWAEVEAAVKDGELPLDKEALADAKLSTEKRKKLPKTTFCGPSRSFPVTDCAHVTAARRLIGRYKGEGKKSSILACISRKAKALGCDSSKKKDNAEGGQVQEDLNHSRMLRAILSVLDEDTYYTNEAVLEEEEKKMLQVIIKRMASLVGKDNYQIALYAEELADNETALVDEVANLEETLGELRGRLDASLKEHNILFQEFEGLHDSLVEEKVENRKIKEAHLGTLVILRDKKVAEGSELTELSSEELDVKIKDTLEVVDMIQIADKLGDGLSRTPTEGLDDPTVIQDSTDQKNNLASVKELERIQEHWMYLRLKSGEAAAEGYLADMKRQGKFPQDSENN